MLRLRLPLPIALALVLLLLTPLVLAAASQPVELPGVDHEEADQACAAPSGPAGLPQVEPATLIDDLTALHALFEGLPGFVDVHHQPDAAVPYVALFIGAVPAGAHQLATPQPVRLVALGATETLPGHEGPAEGAAGGGLGLPVPDDETPGVAAGAQVPSLSSWVCNGIRPGARIVSGGSVCTLAFLFTDGNDIFAATAGHCIDQGKTARIDRGGDIGTAVYSTGDGGVGNDFALIKIKPSMHTMVNGSMCQFGGPESVNGSGIFGEVVLHTGHGGGIVGGVPPRPKTGIGGSWGHKSFAWTGGAIPGDSGSAIQTADGEALGVVTHIGWGYGTGNNYGTRLNTALNTAGYGHLTLLTADLEF